VRCCSADIEGRLLAKVHNGQGRPLWQRELCESTRGLALGESRQRPRLRGGAKLGMPDGAGQQRSEGTSSLSRMWGALAYEIKMYFAMRATHGNPSTPLLLSSFIGNAIAESAILHARILCDLFSSEKKSKKYPDDIGFSDLFDDWGNR
jgi:hypothetical protein